MNFKGRLFKKQTNCATKLQRKHADLQPEQNKPQNYSKICLRAQGPPRARPGPAQRPPESFSGRILGSFWLQFGPSGGSCSSFFGVHVCFFWLAACLLLGALFLLRPLLRCSPSELPGYEAQVTKAIASWPRSLVASCLRSSGGRRQEGVAP